MMKIVSMLLLSFLLLACQDDKQNHGVISVNEQVCNDQTLKNTALWDYMNDWYLWNETLDQSIILEDYSSIDALLDNIKENNPIDRYSLIMTKKEHDDMFVNAQSYGYGMSTGIDTLNDELIVRYVFNDSNAKAIGLNRGDSIIDIAGRNLSDALKDDNFILSEFLQDIDQTQLVSFTWQTSDGDIITKEMQQSTVTTNAVFATELIDSDIGKIGYLVYNSFIDPSHEELNQAFRYFNENNVAELIVDLRYNHGGTSTMSNQLATQIGGNNVVGQIYNAPTNNKNHQSDIEYFNLNGATHHLNLSRVVFITTQESASGSEVLINSLKPYLDVKLVGQRTYGKPVGMLVAQLCDQFVFAITHHNHNADGFGDFFNGIPVDCAAHDIALGDWGHSKDPMLNEALYLLENQQCSSLGDKETNSVKKRLNKQKYSDFFIPKPSAPSIIKDKI